MKPSDLPSPGHFMNKEHLRIECSKAISKMQINKQRGAAYDPSLATFFQACIAKLATLQ